MTKLEGEPQPDMGKVLEFPVPRGWARGARGVPDISKQPTIPDLPAGFARRFLLGEATAITELDVLPEIAEYLGWSAIGLRDIRNRQPELPSAKYPLGHPSLRGGVMMIDAHGIRQTDNGERRVSTMIPINGDSILLNEDAKTVFGLVAVRQLPVDRLLPPTAEELEDLYANLYFLPTASAHEERRAADGA